MRIHKKWEATKNLQEITVITVTLRKPCNCFLQRFEIKDSCTVQRCGSTCQQVRRKSHKSAHLAQHRWHVRRNLLQHQKSNKQAINLINYASSSVHPCAWNGPLKTVHQSNSSSKSDAGMFCAFFSLLPFLPLSATATVYGKSISTVWIPHLTLRCTCFCAHRANWGRKLNCF